jgi:hypothetical protein
LGDFDQGTRTGVFPTSLRLWFFACFAGQIGEFVVLILFEGELVVTLRELWE